MRIRKHNHIKSGTCHTSLQLHVSVIFFLEGKYKGSFSSLSVWLYVFYLSFFFFFTTHHLMFVQKNFTSDAFRTRFLHYTRIIPRFLTGSPPNRRQDWTSRATTSADISHLESQIFFDCFSLRTSRGDVQIMITQEFCWLSLLGHLRPANSHYDKVATAICSVAEKHASYTAISVLNSNYHRTWVHLLHLVLLLVNNSLRTKYWQILPLK